MKQTIRLFLFLALLAGSAMAQTYPQPIPGNGIVNDYVGLTTPAGQAEFKQKVFDAKQNLDIEFGIAVVRKEDLGGLQPFEYATELGRQWGLGSLEGEHRAFMLLIAYSPVKGQTVIRLSPSRHLSGDFPDGKCGNLVRKGHNQFARGDWDAGVNTILTATLAEANAVLNPPPPAPSMPPSEVRRNLLLVFGSGLVTLLAALVYLISRKRRRDRERLLDLAEARRRQEVREGESLINQSRSDYVSPMVPPFALSYSPPLMPTQRPIRQEEPEEKPSYADSWQSTRSESSSSSSVSESRSEERDDSPTVEASGGGDFDGGGAEDNV